jgi:hypothetical protein
MRGIYLQLKKGVTLHVLIKNFKIKEDIRQILWPCLVFSHVSLGIFYLVLLSRLVTVPLLRGRDRGTILYVHCKKCRRTFRRIPS